MPRNSASLGPVQLLRKHHSTHYASTYQPNDRMPAQAVASGIQLGVTACAGDRILIEGSRALSLQGKGRSCILFLLDPSRRPFLITAPLTTLETACMCDIWVFSGCYWACRSASRWRSGSAQRRHVYARRRALFQLCVFQYGGPRFGSNKIQL